MRIRYNIAWLAAAVVAALAVGIQPVQAQQSIVAFVAGMTAFDRANGPQPGVKDKAGATAALHQMEQLAPAVKADAAALLRNLKSSGKDKTFDAQIIAAEQQQKLPQRVISMTQAAGGPLKVLAITNTIIDEDLAQRRTLVGLPKASSENYLHDLLERLNPISKANAAFFCTRFYCAVWILAKATGSEATQDAVLAASLKNCIDAK
jgi:hypothetical protein